MEEKFIKNRKDQNVSVLIEKVNYQTGLVFVMHGLGGHKEQKHIESFVEAFKENGYTVVRFDATNSFGKSDGDYSDATTTNFYEDLEDVINWSKNQDFYQEPFILCGHSLGAFAAAIYAEKYPKNVKALAPISTVVSGELSLEIKSKEMLKEWEKTGWRTEVGFFGNIKKLKWSHIEDRLKYNLLKEVDKLTMPVLLMVGDIDTSTPVKHQQILFDKLPGEKELHIIKGSSHTFRELEHLQEVKEIISKWIKSIK